MAITPFTEADDARAASLVSVLATPGDDFARIAALDSLSDAAVCWAALSNHDLSGVLVRLVKEDVTWAATERDLARAHRAAVVRRKGGPWANWVQSSYLPGEVKVRVRVRV